MVDKRYSHLQKDTLVEWELKLVAGLQLPESALLLIQNIISSVGSFCDSIILYGSWAEGSFHNNSDLDLLFITNNDNDRKTKISQLERMIIENHKPFLDYKVLMIDELRNLSKGLQHFAIWTMVTTGIVLNGHNVRDMFKLSHERVRSLLNDLLDRINHSIADLTADYQYRGACVQVAYTIRTLYFIEKHIIKNRLHHEGKHDYIANHLGNQYKLIERIYQEDVLSKKTYGKLESVRKIQSRKGFHYSSIQYKELLAICLKIEDIIISSKQQLQSLFDLP